VEGAEEEKVSEQSTLGERFLNVRHRLGIDACRSVEQQLCLFHGAMDLDGAFEMVRFGPADDDAVLEDRIIRRSLVH
jgi:hypothetical protein